MNVAAESWTVNHFLAGHRYEISADPTTRLVESVRCECGDTWSKPIEETA